MGIRFIKLYLLLTCFVSSYTVYTQYDTTHYIPYLGDFTGANKMTNLEYENTFGGAYFMFSTFESSILHAQDVQFTCIKINTKWVF